MKDAETLLRETETLETDEARLAWIDRLTPKEQELLLELVDNATKAVQFLGMVARGEIEPGNLSFEESWILHGMRQLAPEGQK